jgi:tRNA(fMet)-specific endonuclease VapC
VARYLLDTNVLGFHVRGASPALEARLRATPESDVALSVITEMEVRFGLERNPSLRSRPLIEKLLRSLTIVPLDSEVARTYGRLRAELERKGRPIGPLDLMIASHALTLGLTLVTNDVREMRRVTGLRCEDWTR